jgi:hypothetical protein
MLLLSSTIFTNKPIAPNKRTTQNAPIPISFEFFSETFHPAPSSFFDKATISSRLRPKSLNHRTVGIQNCPKDNQPEFLF